MDHQPPLNALLALCDQLKRDPVRNYAIPGLTSWMIAEDSDGGCIRLFECSRDHHEHIIPHSHRYDFSAVVLRGVVNNILWRKTYAMGQRGDEYKPGELVYNGAPGKYEQRVGEEPSAPYFYEMRRYTAGERYNMRAEEIHSIQFGRDTAVLMFEGPSVSEKTVFLQPVVDGDIIPTMQVQPWMFKR
jgi:hypothetical protein